MRKTETAEGEQVVASDDWRTCLDRTFRFDCHAAWDMDKLPAGKAAEHLRSQLVSASQRAFDEFDRRGLVVSVTLLSTRCSIATNKTLLACIVVVALVLCR